MRQSQSHTTFSQRAKNYLVLSLVGLLLIYCFRIASWDPSRMYGWTPRDVQMLRQHAKQPKTILVTGGLGFIGSHLVELLLSKGLNVIIFDDESNGHNHNEDATEYIKDITRTNDLDSIKEEVDAVVHLAAAISVAESVKDPEKYSRVNVDGSRNVFEWAMIRNISRVVAASSAAVYGHPEGKLPLDETAADGGLSPYAHTKYKMEGIMQEFATKGLKTIALRFFNVYGPRQDPNSPYSGVISLFMDAATNHRDITILGDGKQTRDFIYVGDLVQAIYMAVLSDLPAFHAFNVCTGKETTIEELAKTIIETSHSASKIKHAESRPGDINKSVCNPSKTVDYLGFRASTPLFEGLGHTSDWLTARQISRIGQR